jgi:hypothetical protein
MRNQEWLDALFARLKEQGLPSWYVERLLRELGDHLDDAETESMDANDSLDRFGQPEQIAESAVREFRRRSFFGRHPRLLRGLSSVLGAAAVAFVTVFFWPAATVAGDYVIECRIEGSDIDIVLNPFTFVLPPKQVQLVNIGGGRPANLVFTIQAGDGTKGAEHEVVVEVSREEKGETKILSYSTTAIAADHEATIVAGPFKLTIDSHRQ